MKKLCATTALLLAFLLLFQVPAFAAGEVSQAVLDKMMAAVTGTVVPSGAAVSPGTDASAAGKKDKPETSSEEEKKDAEKKEEKAEEEYVPVTQTGTEEDVMIGGLRIQPGVWYTVQDGQLVSAPPWPDSYLFYSASQSKLTLHEFSYNIPADRVGTDLTFAALYLPKDIRIVLEGDNKLVNRSYTTANGKTISNGVYAGSHSITFDGDGALSVNTRALEAGYGIAASSIRVEGTFIGLSVFGMSGAFSVAPSVDDTREMIARRADLHPDYNGDVLVKDANPYFRESFTRYRYILFAVGKQLSEMERLQALINAAYTQAQMNYDDALAAALDEFQQAVEQDIAQSMAEFDTNLNDSLADLYNGGYGGDVPSVSLEDWMNGTVFQNLG